MSLKRITEFLLKEEINDGDISHDDFPRKTNKNNLIKTKETIILNILN